MRKGSAIFMLVLFVAILIVMLLKFAWERRASDEYFKTLNLYLTGIVTEVQTVQSANGMIYVDIRSSNVKDHDIRKDDGFYYCVIHNGKADIITGTSGIKVGDSIVINSGEMRFHSFRHDSLIVDRPLRLNQFEPTFSNIKKLHRLEFFRSRYSTSNK